MILPATVTVETMKLIETQGPRWISVDDPCKAREGEIFQYLHGNIYYSRQYELAHGQYMVAFGIISMTLDIEGGGMADIRVGRDGNLVIVNSVEKVNFIWNTFFAEEPFFVDGKLEPSVQKAWSNKHEGKWDERPIKEFKAYHGEDKVDLEFIGGDKSKPKTKKKSKLEFGRSVRSGSDEFREACEQLGKQRHFESRNLKDPQEKQRFTRILQSIVEQCDDLEARFPSPDLDPSNFPMKRKIFYLRGHDD